MARLRLRLERGEWAQGQSQYIRKPVKLRLRLGLGGVGSGIAILDTLAHVSIWSIVLIPKV